ncbi:MAG: hypothetical protein HFG26_07775 [Provencibacterium sp.]|jgi:hypothetical protein|nr:hypothetical protein [Provencibacterium sp.]
MTGINSSCGANLQMAMLSAKSAMMQAKTQTSVQNRLDGRAKVLESEINQDGGVESTSEKKKEELARTKKASEEITKSQAGMLEKANQAVQDAAKAEKKDAEAASAKNAQKAKDSKKEVSPAEEDSKETPSAGKKAESTPSPLYNREGRTAEESGKPALSMRV